VAAGSHGLNLANMANRDNGCFLAIKVVRATGSDEATHASWVSTMRRWRCTTQISVDSWQPTVWQICAARAIWRALPGTREVEPEYRRASARFSALAERGAQSPGKGHSIGAVPVRWRAIRAVGNGKSGFESHRLHIHLV